MRQTICTVLASVMLLEPVLLARATAAETAQPQENGAQRAMLKETLLSIQPQTFVEVLLFDKSKLRGRLGEVSDEGFALQVAQGNKIQNRSVGFDQVKSIKVVEQKGSKVSKGLIYGLAGAGAVFVGILIWAMAVTSGS